MRGLLQGELLVAALLAGLLVVAALATGRQCHWGADACWVGVRASECPTACAPGHDILGEAVCCCHEGRRP